MALSEIKNTSKNLPSEIEAVVSSQVEYYKLYGFKIIAKSATGLVTIFVMGLTLLTISFFLAVAGAFAIGQWLGNPALGFLLMASLLTILAVVIYVCRKHLIHKPLLEHMSDIYFNHD